MRKIIILLLGLFILAASLSAQTKTVTGKVTDSKDGTAMAGVTVKIKNGAAVGVTDASGIFNVSVPVKTKAIIFSSVDYSEIELPVTAGEMLVAMKKGNQVLSEVIISGYVTRSKRANTGSASVISVDDVRSQPNASFDQLLQGQAPGLNVKTGSGQPGTSADVVIRGKGSINGSTNPLYILDGIEIRGSDFSSMNQNDFETITVLKDAASTSIYGSRGSNGVIVITTKKGKAGRLKINYDVQIGTSKLPKNQLLLMNTKEKLDFETKIAGNPWGWTDQQVADYRKINTNWDDYVFRKGNTQSHQ